MNGRSLELASRNCVSKIKKLIVKYNTIIYSCCSLYYTIIMCLPLSCYSIFHDAYKVKPLEFESAKYFIVQMLFYCIYLVSMPPPLMCSLCFIKTAIAIHVQRVMLWIIDSIDTFMMSIFLTQSLPPPALTAIISHMNRMRRVLPHPVSPITTTGILHLRERTDKAVI